MLHKLKNSLKLCILLFGVSIFLIQCQKDDIININQLELENPLYQQRMVSLSQIPEIKNYVSTKINESVFNKTDDELNQAIFDVDNILEVIDTLNNANYSFRFVYPNTPLGEFYNLVVGQTPTGENITPFVLKYKCDESYLEQYIVSGYNINFFKGTVSLHKYTDFFQEGYFSEKEETLCETEYDEFGDPIPCDKNTLDLSDSEGGGTDVSDVQGDPDDTGTTGGTGDGGTGGTNITISEVWHCNWRDQDHASPDACNNPDEGGVWVITITIGIARSAVYNNGAETGDCDCPKDTDGGIGINTLNFDTVKSVLKELTLSTEALNYLIGSDSDEIAIEALTATYLYLEVNQDDFNGGYLPEAESFAAQAIDAFANGGEVDFDEEIIIDSTFVGKAKCIYNKMKIQKLVSNVLSKFEGENAVARITLKLADLSDNDRAITSWPDDNDNIVITLNSDDSFKGVDFNPNLFVVNSIIHEIIHAEFLRQIIEDIGNGIVSGLTESQAIALLENGSHNIIYDYYRETRDWSHNYMADFYRDTFARVTQEFDTGNVVPDNQQPQQLYLDIAWLGLMDFPDEESTIIAFGELPNSEKNRIIAVLNQQLQNNANETCIE